MTKRLKVEWVEGLDLYQVVNKKGDILGDIYFHEDWNAFVWEQKEDIILTWDCLKEIEGFLLEVPMRYAKEKKREQ